MKYQYDTLTIVLFIILISIGIWAFGTGKCSMNCSSKSNFASMNLSPSPPKNTSAPTMNMNRIPANVPAMNMNYPSSMITSSSMSSMPSMNLVKPPPPPVKEPSTPCGWMIQNASQTPGWTTQNIKDLSTACTTYKTVCGTASVSGEILSVSEDVGLEQPSRALGRLNSDVVGVTKDKTKCQAAMTCSSPDDCPSFLTCTKGQCL